VRAEPTPAAVVLGPAAFEAAAAALSSPSSADSADEVVKEEVREDDEDLQRGYIALMSMLVSGVDGGLGKREEGWVTELVAELSFGSPAASSLVTVEQPRSLWGRRRLTLDSSTDMEGISAQLCDGHAASVIRIQLMGDTPAHAAYLARHVEASVESGDLAAKLGARGVERVDSVRVLGAGVKQAATSPQHFPLLDTSSDDDAGDVEVITVRFPDRRPVGILAALVAVLAGLLVCVSAMLWSFCRRSARVGGCASETTTEDKFDAGKEETVLDIPGAHKGVKTKLSFRSDEDESSALGITVTE
jgi:hypothetical protein